MMKISVRVCIVCWMILAMTSCSNEFDKIKTEGVAQTTEAQTRVYYVAAVEEIWDYAPSGKNLFAGTPFMHDDSVYTVNINTPTMQRIGRKYRKARYVEYTDSTFTTAKAISPEWQHLGILGPVIRATVGDSVVIHFKNATTIHSTLHVHGLLYDINSDGAGYDNGATGGIDVAPGEKYTYRYFAREGAGPSPSQGSSIAWVYHSHVRMEESDVYAGLFGVLIVTKKGMGDSHAKPIDVDREFATLFMNIDENKSVYLQENIDTYLPGFTNPNPDDFTESNIKACINGMVMGNLPGLVMNKGERVRWYLVALGTEVDLHTPHWHGNTVNYFGQNTDVIELLPAASVTVDMKPDNIGTWAFHCHVGDHLAAGMTALYTVN